MSYYLTTPSHIVFIMDKHAEGHAEAHAEGHAEAHAEAHAEGQDTGKFRINTKDQFYTSPNVAKKCIETVIYHLHNNTLLSPVLPLSSYLWIEPSAGNGAFLHNIPDTYDKIGIDIDPRAANILKQDFLTWMPSSSSSSATKPIIVFGNPPFGSQSTLAKAFIAHSCKFASIIAFILPKSFVKPSMSCAFDTMFHCMHTSDIAPHAFVINDGTTYDVPCVFQIWQKMSAPRVVAQKVTEKGFQYVKNTEGHHLAFRRVGVYAGRCYITNMAGEKIEGVSYNYSPQSHHFLKLDDSIADHIMEISRKINSHIFPSNTVGPRSLSKTEINTVLNSILQNL
jgi:predicted RNA methylase